jgi:hypothetical protein
MIQGEGFQLLCTENSQNVKNSRTDEAREEINTDLESVEIFVVSVYI